MGGWNNGLQTAEVGLIHQPGHHTSPAGKEAYLVIKLSSKAARELLTSFARYRHHAEKYVIDAHE